MAQQDATTRTSACRYQRPSPATHCPAAPCWAPTLKSQAPKCHWSSCDLQAAGGVQGHGAGAGERRTASPGGAISPRTDFFIHSRTGTFSARTAPSKHPSTVRAHSPPRSAAAGGTRRGDANSRSLPLSPPRTPGALRGSGPGEASPRGHGGTVRGELRPGAGRPMTSQCHMQMRLRHRSGANGSGAQPRILIR